jgi:hypothetical protein
MHIIHLFPLIPSQLKLCGITKIHYWDSSLHGSAVITEEMSVAEPTSKCTATNPNTRGFEQEVRERWCHANLSGLFVTRGWSYLIFIAHGGVEFRNIFLSFLVSGILHSYKTASLKDFQGMLAFWSHI